jgi:hypothetical protein
MNEIVTPEWAMKFARVCELADHECTMTDVDICERCSEYIKLKLQIKSHFGIPPWIDLADDFEVSTHGLTVRETQAEWADALTDALKEAAPYWEKAQA